MKNYTVSLSSVRTSTTFLVGSFVSFLISQVTSAEMESTIVFALFAIVFAIREHSEGVALKELQKQLNDQLAAEDKPL